jgi:hypothetical protein
MFRRKKHIRTNQEMLKLIRADRPGQVINEVISFEKNKYGFYDVFVDMESQFYETRIKHVKMRLPYPYKKYEDLPKNKQEKWRSNE